MGAEFLSCTPKRLSSRTLVAALILIETVDIVWMLARNFLKFVLFTNQVASGFFCDISAAELIVANPNNGLFPILERHLPHGIGDVKPVAYLVTVVTVYDDVIPCDDWIPAAVDCKIHFKLKILLLSLIHI